MNFQAVGHGGNLGFDHQAMGQINILIMAHQPVQFIHSLLHGYAARDQKRQKKPN